MTHRRAIPHQTAGGWTPPAGLLAWYYGSSLTDGKWTDRSGNGLHAPLAAGYSLSDEYGLIQSLPYPGYTIIVRPEAGNGSLVFWARNDVLWEAGFYNRGGFQRHTNGNVYQNTAEGVQQSAGFSATAGWHHYAQISNNGTIRTYKDGVLGATISPYTIALKLTLYSVDGIDDIMPFDEAIDTNALADIRANSPGSHA